MTCHRLAHLIQRAHLHIHKHPLLYQLLLQCPILYRAALFGCTHTQWVAFSNKVKCDMRPLIRKYNHRASVPRFLLFLSAPDSLALIVTTFHYCRAVKDILPQLIHATVVSPNPPIFFCFVLSDSGGPCGLHPRSSGIAPMPTRLT